ncbi:FadR/GntR family transcriptional regulator [Commensalibacter nepenthis]|uniref:FadR/GntR family transcriptional regulator n=1 Tax=Commensalibacter nepenthis TaxID=3043872 RepID=A0ABT6QA76_9PROT|nr:FadR/GntR family transcriptional regulator [Commensalibacter sp. TBRC 10068]MDI2113815.1 FadR/GntR family transcriptional regulator [Commensalibacter sp. TBRC 10068]
MLKTTALPQLNRVSLVESTIHLIRSQIKSGKWKVGERIPKEADLATMLQVGRNTVREAIRALSHAQILEVRQGDGTYVRCSVDPAEVMRRVNSASLKDHFELRAILETEAARLAAIRRTDEDLKEIDQLLKERGDIPTKDNLVEFIERDIAFHTAITKAAHNEALLELYSYFSIDIQNNVKKVKNIKNMKEPGKSAHLEIVQAIKDQNPEKAGAAAKAVIMPIIENLIIFANEV